MILSAALKNKLMDVRLRDKLVAEGKITKEEVAQYMSELSDETSNATDTLTVETERKAALEQ
ncbi:MAG: hypothetical protein KAG61_04850 [Bacteriovoracaceae bacterium]|nr:hypothetical protein [Bacteriovoracaceae bacterium]